MFIHGSLNHQIIINLMKMLKFQYLQHEHGPDTIHLYTSLTNNIIIELLMLQFFHCLFGYPIDWEHSVDCPLCYAMCSVYYAILPGHLSTTNQILISYTLNVIIINYNAHC